MDWGLLEGMGQGMQQAGTNMYEQAKLERINEWKQQQRADDRQYQEQQTQEQWARDDQIRADESKAAAQSKHNDRAFEWMKDQNNHQQQMQIEGVKSKANAEQKALDRQARLDAARIRAGGDGLMEGMDSPEGVLHSKAEAYADTKIGELSGYLTTDSRDFARWNGSREDARQFFIKEFLQKNSGGYQDPSSALSILDKKFGPR